MDILELLKVVLIGIVEGITEWLPISSTGHMLLVDELITLNVSEAFKEMFIVVIQLGAILAVVVMFWGRMFPLRFKEKPTIKKDVCSIWLKVIVACIPSIVLGLLLDEFLEQHFGNAVTIAIMLIVYGAAFIVIERWNKKRTARIEEIYEIDYKTALMIGLFQVLAMIPGTSRSGATIIGALLIGVSRTAAAEFTFFLAVPTMFGASALKLLKFGFDFTSAELIMLITGSAVAFGVSLLAVRFLMSYIKKRDFSVFGWYRIALGLCVIGVLVLLA